MGISSGGRLSELFRLRWCDVDFDKCTGMLHVTKNGQRRKLLFTAKVMDELQKFREIGTALIFRSDKNPNKPFPFRKHWKQALLQAHIEDFRFHDLRHTCASYLARENVSAMKIKEILGHRSLKSTERYVQLDVEENQQIVEAVMNKYLGANDD